MTLAKWALLSIALLGLSSGGCRTRPAQAGDDERTQGAAQPARAVAEPATLEQPGLSQVRQVAPRMLIGGQPQGEQGFASLKRLGINTVVSVDGAKPNLELARAHGLRYIHIPIGYDGIPPHAAGMLSRVGRDVRGRVYIHCHHGKHRAPAAAAIACLANGSADVATAIKMLEQAGTSPDYAGLWRDVENFRPPPHDAQLPALVEVAEVNSLAAAMAQMDRAFDNLKRCRNAGWQTPETHPDLVASQEALLLWEGLRESLRSARDNQCDEQLEKSLVDAEDRAHQLLLDLRSHATEAADTSFTSLEQSCRRCHATYRDR